MPHRVLGDAAFEWNGTWYKTALTSADSDGAIAIVDSVSPPDSGPPRHIHHRQDETFVVLTGQIEFWLEGERFTRGPGESAFVPKGREHTFRVAGQESSRHLVITTPGGLEAFIEEVAGQNLTFPDDMGRIVELARRHSLEFTGPPLADD